MSNRKPSRAAAQRLLADLIAQATVDNEEQRLDWSPKLRQIAEKVLDRMGFTPPSRVTFEGLAGLLEEAAGDGDGREQRYPLVFRAPGQTVYRWVTVELDEVMIKGESYTAMVIELHPE